MARFFGTVGFAVGVREGTGENEGIVTESPVVERVYFGDIVQNSRRFDRGSDINDDLQIAVKISIVADDYANEHVYAMKYVEWMGAKWKITYVEPQRPRLILTIGGVYNGPTPGSSS